MTKITTNSAEPYHVLIVDDEALARQRLQRLVDAMPGYRVVAQAQNIGEAMMAVEQMDPDIVLMDISMPGMSGLSAAKHLSSLPDAPAVIFCTAYDQYALDAFDAKACGYLVKPIEEEKLAAALDQASQLNKAQRRQLDTGRRVEQPKERQFVSIKTRKGIELVPLEQVYCFVADQKYVTVYHAEGESLIDDTLKELEVQYGAQFVRVHRNTLASVEHISALTKNNEGHYQLLLGEANLQPLVSRRHLSAVKNLLKNL